MTTTIEPDDLIDEKENPQILVLGDDATRSSVNLNGEKHLTNGVDDDDDDQDMENETKSNNNTDHQDLTTNDEPVDPRVQVYRAIKNY